MKQKIIIGLVALVLFAGLTIPSWLLIRERTDNAENMKRVALQIDFLAKVNPQVQIVGIEKPEDAYILYYKGSEDIHAAIWSKGIWADLGIVQVSENATGDKLK